MDYLIVNHTVETEGGPAPGTPEFQEMMGRWMAYNQMLIDNGHWIGGGSLTPSSAATSVAKSGDSVKVTDGPFAETKEQIGGYYIIKAEDLDEAIRLATAMPADDVVFEIRPIAFRPDA
ncbi:MAG: YciI family protein [Actinomycetota bacterium]